MQQDFDIGMLVLVANAHWKAASRRLVLAAWLFGKHKIFEHLGKRARVSFYRDVPYLLSFSEVRRG